MQFIAAGIALLLIGIVIFVFGVIVYKGVYDLVSSGTCKLGEPDSPQVGVPYTVTKCATDITPPVVAVIVGIAAIAGGIVMIAKSRRPAAIAQ